MLGVVVDPRHHVRAAEALRVLERGVGDQLAGLEIEQAEHDGRRAEVHRQAVDRAGRPRRFPRRRCRMRSPSRVTAGSSARPACRAAQVERMPLESRMLAAPHRVAARRRRRRRRSRAWHDSRKCAASRCCSSGVGGDSSSMPLGDLDEALLALALLHAGRRHAHAEPLGVLEEREPRHCRGRLAVEGERHRHRWAARLRSQSRPWLRARRAPRRPRPAAEPSRSCSSLQRHCAR